MTWLPHVLSAISSSLSGISGLQPPRDPGRLAHTSGPAEPNRRRRFLTCSPKKGWTRGDIPYFRSNISLPLSRFVICFIYFPFFWRGGYYFFLMFIFFTAMLLRWWMLARSEFSWCKSQRRGAQAAAHLLLARWRPQIQQRDSVCSQLTFACWKKQVITVDRTAMRTLDPPKWWRTFE